MSCRQGFQQGFILDQFHKFSNHIHLLFPLPNTQEKNQSGMDLDIPIGSHLAEWNAPGGYPKGYTGAPQVVGVRVRDGHSNRLRREPRRKGTFPANNVLSVLR